MSRLSLAGGALALLFILAVVGFVTWNQVLEDGADFGPAPASPGGDGATSSDVHPSHIYGRVTTTDGTTYEGWLRWGGGEEAFWSDYFNGTKIANPWADHVPAERLPTKNDPIVVFGVKLADRERPVNLDRPFMVRFGEIERIEANGPDLRVTTKDGTEFALDRFGADDFADGLRIWDTERGVVDLVETKIGSVELFAPPSSGSAADRLYGTLETRQGESFTGFVQWNRKKGSGTDLLEGQNAGSVESHPFGTVRSIVRESETSVRVTFDDDREVILTDTQDTSRLNRGAYVEDPRYGRVLVPWDAFERIDFADPGNGDGDGNGGLAYDDFPPGRPLTGTVTTRAGRSLTGRLVFDLDESRTTETLDAPARGVDYTIPFGLIASISPPGQSVPARVTLHNGERLALQGLGDLSVLNAGILVFEGGDGSPEYVSWGDVDRIELDRPEGMVEVPLRVEVPPSSG
jgi:hypothetical protein